MRILTYNLHFGGAGHAHWKKVFNDFDPDVFLVQESYEPILHLPPEKCGDRHQHAHWNPVENLKWGSAVYVKGGNARPLELPDFQGHVAGVEIAGDAFLITVGRPLRIFSVHAPDRGGYHRAVNLILDVIAAHRGEGDLLIGGDFNMDVGERPAADYRRTSKADLAILSRLRDEFGLVSAWQAANIGLPLAQTLRWTRSPTTPYHCDGIFIPQRWTKQLRTCNVVSGPEWDKLSDHNPVLLDIDAPSFHRNRK